MQNFPLFRVPQEQVHPSPAAGFGFPQFMQKAPEFAVPQEHVHEFAAGCCDAA